MIENFGRYAKAEPFDIIYYYVNEKFVTIEEFIKLEYMALDFVSDKKYRIFKTYDTEIGFVTVSKN